jgi:hypothetical protein
MNAEILTALNLSSKQAHNSQISIFYKFLEPEDFHYIWITNFDDYECSPDTTNYRTE